MSDEPEIIRLQQQAEVDQLKAKIEDLQRQRQPPEPLDRHPLPSRAVMQKERRLTSLTKDLTTKLLNVQAVADELARRNPTKPVLQLIAYMTQLDDYLDEWEHEDEDDEEDDD